MTNIIKKLFSSSKRSADECFRRFIELNRHRYLSMCLTSEQHSASEVAEGVVAACQRWLPDLKDPRHREICRTISELHKATQLRAVSLKLLKHQLAAFVAEEFSQKEDSGCVFCGDPATRTVTFGDGHQHPFCGSDACVEVFDTVRQLELTDIQKYAQVH